MYRFVNRLSDYLFASARLASFCEEKAEREWEKLDFDALREEEESKTSS